MGPECLRKTVHHQLVLSQKFLISFFGLMSDGFNDFGIKVRIA